MTFTSNTLESNVSAAGIREIHSRADLVLHTGHELTERFVQQKDKIALNTSRRIMDAIASIARNHYSYVEHVCICLLPFTIGPES